jgi:TPR repeat protein
MERTTMEKTWWLAANVLSWILCSLTIGSIVYAQETRGPSPQALESLRQRAENGDARAQSSLGMAYFLGQGAAQRDDVEAFRWFRKAADQGDALGESGLAAMYESGRGAPKDSAEAVRWYRKAADQGEIVAQLALGFMYGHGIGVARDFEEAARWTRKAAEQGSAMAQVNLGTVYSSGIGVGQDYTEAVRWFRRAADQGFPPGQAHLGNMYLLGSGVPQDATEAARWIRRAAEQRDPSAQYFLGAMYEAGTGVPKDDSEAVRWFRLSAEQGNALAQSGLAFKLLQGSGVAPDPVEALRWLRRSAEQGHANAQYNLAVAYEKGEGVVQDLAEAFGWYKKAADQGMAAAQFTIANMYSAGRGAMKDDAEAVRWLRRAAEQGNAMAQLSLGVRYFAGKGLAQDNVQALLWAGLAATWGTQDAKKAAESFLQAIAPKVTSQQSDEAAKLKTSWRPKQEEIPNLAALFQRQAAPVTAATSAAAPSSSDDLESILQSLKGKLIGSGRTEYSYSWTRLDNARLTSRKWQQVTGAEVDASRCEMRVHLLVSSDGAAPKEQPVSLFFESIDSVEILPEQVALGFVQEFSGTAYRLITNGDTSSYAALFASESQANNAAEDLRRAARICHSQPVVVSAAAGAPPLPETLRDIADQLNAQGTVGWRIGNAAAGSDVAVRLSQVVPDPITCQIRYNRDLHISAVPGVTREVNDKGQRNHLSFRRMQKVHVVSEGQTGPPVYGLHWNDNPVPFFAFPDAAAANRVANAMQHAADLCGGGTLFHEQSLDNKRMGLNSLASLLQTAQKGDAQAQSNLGVMYQTGNGVGQDFAEAARWFGKAADLGNVSAQFALALAYSDGRGVVHDDAQAARWLKRAAEQGHATAQFYLGLSYYAGKGVAQDNMQALMWALLAQTRCTGEEQQKARNFAQTVASKVTSEQLEEADRLAKAWQPKREGKP